MIGIPKPTKKKKEVTVRKLKNTLKDLVYSFVKRRDGPVCISCGKQIVSNYNWHAGHYLPMSTCNLIWKYEPWNIHSQCGRCNMFLSGNHPAYRKAMIKLYGKKSVENMENVYNMPLPLDFNVKKYLNEQIDKFRELLENLKQN